MADKSEKEWFADWFNHPLYLKVYNHRDDAEARTCLETIIHHTGLATFTPADIRVMDIACGAGRHVIEFARRGFMTTANDLSPFLLERTRKQASKENLSLECTSQDMRCISAENSYDLVVQLFSSFGYFKTPEEDLQVVQNVRKALKPDGWYILDLINPVYLKKTLASSSSRTIDDLKVTEERRIERDRVLKQITITSRDESVAFEESVRLYEQEHVCRLLESNGFEIKKILGDYEGSAYDPEASPRLLIFARKQDSL